MKNWKAYKKTYRTESTLFDYARTGDLRGFANLLSSNSQLDINAVNERGYSALMLAVYNGEKDFCEALLRCGADVNSVDTMGNTVLMGAAYKGHVDTLALLLAYGANINLENRTKMNVRDWAVMFGRNEVITFLDEHYPSQISSSKIKNIIRFIKLGFMLVQSKFRGQSNHINS
jgi:ankyrin repeat protein